MPGKRKTVVKKAFVDPLKNRNIGRRTGIDIKAGKNIRKDEEGFELFDDYWTESEDESLYLSRTKERSVVNQNNRTLSNNRGNVHRLLHSMSPFVPSSVENSAPASPQHRKDAKPSGTSGAALNYKGEVLGTITRLGSTKNSQATKVDEQPCSALLSFRMKKRLRYSEALRKSSETAGSDQAFAVPRQPERGRRSTLSQVTAEKREALPVTAGSQESQGSSDVGNSSANIDRRSASSEAESERNDVSSVKNTRNQSMTLRRSSRRSKSIYRDSSNQQSQESSDTNVGSNVDSEALLTDAESGPSYSPRKRSVNRDRKSRNTRRERPNQEMQRSMNGGSDVDSEAVPIDSSNSTAPQTDRSTHKSSSSCPESSSQETLGVQTSTNSDNTVDSGPAESELITSEASEDVDSSRKQSLTLRSSHKSKSSCPENSTLETQQSSDMNGDAIVDSESVQIKMESEISETSRNVDSPRKRSVTLRSSRKLKTSCPENSSQEIEGSPQSCDMNSVTNVDNVAVHTEVESETSEASQNVDSPRKQSVTSMNSHKSKSSCPENLSRDTQGSQSSDMNGGIETVHTKAESETSEASQNVDSPRKQPVTLRQSPRKSKSWCEPLDNIGETDIAKASSKKGEFMPNKSRRETGNNVKKRVRVAQDQLTTAGVDTEHVTEGSAGEKAVVDSPAAPSLQTSCPMRETQSETDEDVASENAEHDADIEVSGGVCSEVAMDTDDFLSDSSSETEEQWCVPPVSHLIGAGDGPSQMSDHSTGAGSPSDVDGHTMGTDNNTECHTDAVGDDRTSVTDDDDGGTNSTDVNGGGYSDDSDADDNKGQHSLYRTSSPLIIDSQKQLHDVHVTSPDKEVATRQSNSFDGVSRRDTSPASAATKAVDVTSDAKQGSDGFTSEEDFEIEEPCFRVFGSLKQSSAEKDQGMGTHPQAKARKVVTTTKRSRAKATIGKKAGINKESAKPSPGDSDDEAGPSPRLQVGEKKRSKDARKRVSSKTHENQTETPSAPPIPQLQILSLRRKIDLSQSVQGSPGGSTRNVSDASADATGKTRKKRISTSELGEIPWDDALELEDAGISERVDSLPRRHPKLAKKGKRSPAQRENTNEDNEGETSGKKKTTKQERKKQGSQEKGKKQGGKSSKRRRIVPTLSDDELEEPTDLGLGSPRQVLSFENSNQDISLPGSSLSPIEGRSPMVLPGQSPSPPSAVASSKTKQKIESGAQRLKSSKSRKIRTMSPPAQKKPPALKKSLKSKQVARLMGGKHQRSIYGLTPVVKMPSQKSVASIMPATAPRSILKKGGRYSTDTPVHYFNTTESAVTPFVATSQPSKNVKIIIPDDTEEENGVRRSQRTRVLPLDWFRNERILYQPRKSGGYVVAGIVSPEIPEIKKDNKKKRRKMSPKTAKSRQPTPTTTRNLSIHQPLPENCNLVTSTLISVINPTTEEEVSIECVKSNDAFNFCGPQGNAASATDPLILCKALNQKAFSIGQLVLRPLQEKGTHYVRRDTMVFIIKQGKLAVTIHKTTSVLETDDVFFVPQGNTYNLTNLRNDDAKVWFFQLKQ